MPTKQSEPTVSFSISFKSGFAMTTVLDLEDVTSGEYWTAFTAAQNEYDLGDEPVAVDGIRLDDDGDWLIDVDDKICKLLGIDQKDLYA